MRHMAIFSHRAFRIQRLFSDKSSFWEGFGPHCLYFIIWTLRVDVKMWMGSWSLISGDYLGPHHGIVFRAFWDSQNLKMVDLPSETRQLTANQKIIDKWMEWGYTIFRQYLKVHVHNNANTTSQRTVSLRMQHTCGYFVQDLQSWKTSCRWRTGPPEAFGPRTTHQPWRILGVSQHGSPNWNSQTETQRWESDIWFLSNLSH